LFGRLVIWGGSGIGEEWEVRAEVLERLMEGPGEWVYRGDLERTVRLDVVEVVRREVLGREIRGGTEESHPGTIWMRV
jgi:hypothetical protein